MAKQLTALAAAQLSNIDIRKVISFTIAGTERQRDMYSFNVSYDRDFGIAVLSVEMNNKNGQYSVGGSKEVKMGDEVTLTEMFGGATDRFKIFTGYVRQRSISKISGVNNITLTCMDFIVKLEETDINKLFEATKIQITKEVLSPEYLASPNDMYASIFNFANENLADYPPVSLQIKDKDTELSDPQFDGFSINYETGQVTLGVLLNARDNYELVSTYNFYPLGQYAEDIIEGIIKEKTSYNNYLFGETSAADLVTNHLTETLNNMEDSNTDTMTPNWITEEDVNIITNLDTAVTAGDISITVEDTTGFPTTGTGTINGDTFTWTGKTAITLTGIPATGSTALLAHPIDSKVIYTADYGSGQLWYTTYNNISTTLTAGDFTIPGGASFSYFDKQHGRLFLDLQIAPTSTVTCNTNYSFCTIQATGIEINKINFSERKIKNRFEALNEVRKMLPPNYLIRTMGEDKIWATYVNQKINADFTIKAVRGLDYGEDQDLYTRTKFFGKNQNPTNIMFSKDISFVNTGQTYDAIAYNTELTYDGEDGVWRKYITGLSAGKILITSVEPIIYIDGNPVDNNIHEILNSQCTIEKRTRTEKHTRKHTSSDDEISYSFHYYYKVYFGNSGIKSSEVLSLYGATGTVLFTLGPNDGNINYEEGYWNVPGDQENSQVEQVSTADYWIMYSTDKIQIDYDNVTFRINKSLIPEPGRQKITATFEYATTLSDINEIGNCFDGRYDTQTQSVFYAKPPSNYIYATIDLGSIQSVQAIDILSGFFKPWDNPQRKIDFTNYYTLQWSLDGTNFFDIAPETNNFSLSGGDTIQWDEDILGANFELRYFRLILDDLEKIEYNPENKPSGGVWVVAFTEIMIFSDIILKGEGELIPTTTLSSNVLVGDTSVPVLNTLMFRSGAGTAYINGDAFDYTSKSALNFNGCLGVGNHGKGVRVSETIEADATIYDDDLLLEKIGEVVYKETTVNEYLDTQTKLNYRAKNYEKEFYKNHTRSNIDVLWAPHLKVGHTVQVNDALNRISRNYFIESITFSNQGVNLVLAYYP